MKWFGSQRWKRVFFGTNGLRAGWALLLWLVVFAAFAAVFSATAHHLLRDGVGGRKTVLSPGFTLVGESVSLFVVLASTYVMCRVEKRPFRIYGLGGTAQLRTLFVGGVWGLLLLSLLMTTLRMGGWLVYDGRLLTLSGALRFGSIWLVVFLILGLFEENMLRGYTQFTLARGIGFWWSAFILSFLFGFVHKNNPGESPIGLVSAGLIGLVFCLSLRRTGALWWAIGFHASWDWGESFLFGVSNSGSVAEGRLFAFHPSGNVLMSGGATGPEGSILVLVAIALAGVIVLVTQRPLNSSANPPLES